MPEIFTDLLWKLQVFAVVIIVILFFIAALIGIGYIVFIFWKYRDREKHSLEYALMQIAVPRKMK